MITNTRKIELFIEAVIKVAFKVLVFTFIGTGTIIAVTIWPFWGYLSVFIGFPFLLFIWRYYEAFLEEEKKHDYYSTLPDDTED